MSKPLAEYLPAGQVQKKYAIARSTLRAWAESGKVEALRAGGNGKRLYKLTDVEHVLGVDAQRDETPAKRRICYARVSSAHQRADLERQCAFLRQHYSEHEHFADIGSGLNFKRPHFVQLLDAVHSGTVGEIVVTDKDRLCRFGIDLVQWVLDKAGTKLVVHHEDVGEHCADDDGEPDYNHELSDDVISVITFFTARHNGQRAARNRKRRREDTEAAEKEGRDKKRAKATRRAHQEDPHLSNA